MAITNPLSLPEIRDALAPFLTTDDLTRCVRVCKDWYTSFLPHLWSTVVIQAEKSKQPTLEDLQGHKDHVRHLNYQIRVPRDHFSIHFPSLRILHLRYVQNKDLGIIGNHPSLTHVTISGAYNVPWTPPVNLSNLTSLVLYSIIVGSQDLGTVWSLFSRLETLELWESTIPGFPKTVTGAWRLKDLMLVTTDGTDTAEQLRWMEHCTHLKRMTWIPIYEITEHRIEEFVQSVAANTWPELEELDSSYFRTSERQASLVIGGMRRILSLSVDCQESFDLVKTALRPHFPWINKLEVTAPSCEDTSFIIEILESCPQLETLQMGTIQVGQMLRDNVPWACEGSLKRLKVRFGVDDDISGAGQKVLFERLSRLRSLERLDLCTEEKAVQSLDLRLESGLEQLATLTRLEELAFCGTVQHMTMKDVEWMIDHWKKLRRVRGKLNPEADTDCDEMSAKLREAGVSATEW